MRFEMARALARRAKERADWIGDDHGDPYEEALISRTVSIEMHIALKEVLDHLRSALDYCAHEVCEAATGLESKENIYFPITRREFVAENFSPLANRLMPGVLKYRPELISVIAQFQPFFALENGWIADLSTLANRTKHDILNVNSVSSAKLTVTRDIVTGKCCLSICRSGESIAKMGGLALIDAPNGIDGADCRYVCLWLGPIQQELLSFLRPAISGVPRIIDALEQAL